MRRIPAMEEEEKREQGMAPLHGDQTLFLPQCFRRKKLAKRPGYMRTETQKEIKFQAFSGQLEQSRKRNEDCKNGTVKRLSIRDLKSCSGSSVVNDSIATTSMQADLTTIVGTTAGRSRNVSNCKPLQSENVPFAIPQREFPSMRCLDLLKADALGTERKTFSCAQGEEAQNLNSSHENKVTNNYETENQKVSGDFSWSPYSFNSSFNFIQMSMKSDLDPVNQSHDAQLVQVPTAGSPVSKVSVSKGLCESGHGSNSDCLPDSKVSCCHSNKDFECAMQTFLDCVKMQDCKIFPDTDTTLSCSTDSDVVSAASSVTSDYESSVTPSDVSWNTLITKYESVLSDCLLGNQTVPKVKSLRLKLQRLQEKAVEKEDYEKADEFQKKLEELEQEMKMLKFQLPSRHPSVCIFLDRFRAAVQAALYWMADGVLSKEKHTWPEDKQKHTGCSKQEMRQVSATRRERLVQEKQHLQEEIEILKVRLTMLETKDRQLGYEIEEHDLFIQMQDTELMSLLTHIPLDELHEINKALDEILASSCRNSLSLELPEMLKSLQEKEHSLIVSIKETTAKVCTSQKLCCALWRKASNIESQLPALLEAKMLAVSGNHFCTAKQITDEIRSLMLEKQGLEGLRKELLLLGSKNDRKLERIKEEHSRLKQALDQGEAAFEKNLKEHAIKYMDMLEDKLHRCGSQLLEKVWEADLEACQLLVRGFQEEESGYCEETDEVETAEEACLDSEGRMEYLFLKAFKAVHNSTIQHKHCELKEEFHLMSSDMRETCEAISEKVKHLEDQLQIAVYSHDEGLVQSLQREIQMVKETLQAMLVQLQPAKDEDNENLCDSW